MATSRLPERLIQLLWLLVILVLVGGGLLARETHDGHWFARSGALIAALAAGAVLVQIAVEIGLEHERHALEARREQSGPPGGLLMPIDRLAARIFENQTRQAVQRLERQRLRVALRVVVCAMLGELLHGFGEPLACWLFVACQAHG